MVSISVKCSRYLPILFKHKINIKIFCFIFQSINIKNFCSHLKLDWICIIIMICNLSIMTGKGGGGGGYFKQNPNIM